MLYDEKRTNIGLFYNHHLKEVQIAKQLLVSQPYVSKVIKANTLYIAEMKNRKLENAEKRKLYLAEYQKNYTRSKKEDIIYDAMKLQHKIDTQVLSYWNAISDLAYWKSNSSIYHFNPKKNRVEIDRKITVSKDIPRYITTNVKLKTQKYKKPCFCMK